MTRRPWLVGSTVLLAAGVCGCEDAGKKPVQAHVPALASAKTATATAQIQTALPQFPLRNSLAKPMAARLPPVPPVGGHGLHLRIAGLSSGRWFSRSAGGARSH